jgi:hypothetical protein
MAQSPQEDVCRFCVKLRCPMKEHDHPWALVSVKDMDPILQGNEPEWPIYDLGDAPSSLNLDRVLGPAISFS